MKKLYSREEFKSHLKEMGIQMNQDEVLKKQALDMKIRAGHKYYWVHQTSWMGEPCLQLAQDMMALQEVIYKSRPDYIIESGVAWGGTMLYLASLLKLYDGKKVIGMDIYVPDDLKSRLFAASNPVKDHMVLINASSVEESTLNQVKQIIGDSQKVMVLLDSDHTHSHVLKELQMYAPLVSLGQYLICGDTTIERQPPAAERPREWGKGNNPLTALREFQKTNSDFQVDEELENKLLLTNNPEGYLVRVK